MTSTSTAHTALAPHVEEALARVAHVVDPDILTLRALFDALAVAPSSADLLEDLRARLAATLGDDVANALTDGARDVAQVSRRGERLIRLVAALGRA